MYKFPVGAMLESFRMEPMIAVDEAARLGLDGLQIYLSRGPMAPTTEGSAELRKKVYRRIRDAGMIVSAVCGDFGKGFSNPEQNPALIEASKRVMDAALDFDCRIVTTHIGRVPADSSNDTFKIMQDACGTLAEYADAREGHFAMETGPEYSFVLRPFLDSLHSRGVAVNLDPANLAIMVSENPVSAVRNLGPYIVHTHAKDGVCIWVDNAGGRHVHPLGDPLDPYRKYEEDERPLGEGDVPFPSYLAALEEVGYRGFLTIEREVGADPATDIAKAADMLRSILI